LGSVGVAWPGVELKLENNELKARLQFKRSIGYLNAGTVEARSVFEDTGWINTGDVSAIEHNFIFIKGRTKDTIITDRGKNINPNPIEEKLRYGLDVSHVVLYGDNRSYLIALISLKLDQIITKDEIAAKIDSFNLNLGEHEKIKNFILTNQPYTIENGLMTRSGKIRRKLIWEKYKKEIDECYE
jgi:long-chain acyl-CoA synthetase